MKKILQLILVLVLISCVLIPYPLKIAQAENSPKTHLVITEVASMPASDEEWIEIYNPGPNSYTISTLTFFENDTNHGVSSIHGETTLEPKTTAIIANKADIFANKHPELNSLLLDSSWSSLKQEGETIALKVSGVTVDSSTYGVTSDEAETTERIMGDDTWIVVSPTPGVLSDVQQIFFTEEPQTPATIETPQPEPSAEQTPPTQDDPPQPANSPVTAPATPSAQAPTPQQTAIPPLPNREPVAVIEIQSGQTTGTEKTTINFDGRKSFDPEGAPLQFLWTFGDGTSAQTANPGFHTFANPGEYLVTLLVVDAAGLRGYAYEKVTVAPKTLAPTQTAAARAPQSSTQKTSSPLTPAIKSTTSTGNLSSPSTQPSTITINLSYDDARTFLQSYFLESAANTQATSLVVANEGLTPSFANQQSSHEIFLNEILPAPAKGEDEWIEIANSTNTPRDVSGWLLADETKSKKPFSLPTNTIIPAHGFIVITSKQSKISLNNDADTLYLAQPNGTVVDSLSYTSAKKLESYARYTTTWAWSGNPSPGKSNGVLQSVRGNVTSVEVQKNGELSAPRITITDDNENTHEIFVQADDPNADVTKAFFEPGSDVALTAYEDASGREQLAEVQKISPPGDAQPSTQEKSSMMLYVVIGFLAVLNGAILAAGVYLYWQGHLSVTKKTLTSPQQSEPPDEEDFI